MSLSGGKAPFWSIYLLQLPATHGVSPTCQDIWVPKRQEGSAPCTDLEARLENHLRAALGSHPEATLKPSAGYLVANR